MTIRIAPFAALLTGALLVGCAGYSDVSEKRPQFVPRPAGAGTLAVAEKEITNAFSGGRKAPLASLGNYLDAAQTAEAHLKSDPRSKEAKRDYNFAVARIVEVIREGKLSPWSQPLHVPGPNGEFTLVDQPDPRPEWNPALFDFTPADQFDVGGKYTAERVTRDGIGAPAVASEREAKVSGRKGDFAPSLIFRCVTAVAHFEGRRCVLSFRDPLDVETVTLGEQTYPLAADFTVPLAVMLDRTDPQKHEIARMLNPDKYAQTAAIERLQPYNPDKTIVLVIHGLMDSQATWTPMINRLRGDEEIRKHYQFWFYSYPSGYPYPYAATILRSELDALEKRYPARKPMVVIGHSMGGCIGRLLLTDSTDKLWLHIFGKPPSQVPLSPPVKAYFTKELFFRHRPEIGRVIFISAPLRGSDLAVGWPGRLAGLLIKPARLLGQASHEMLQVTSTREEELRPKPRANSIDTLSPKSRFVNAVNTIPMTPGVPYHTIIGDRGRGDSPNSSDGVVPYWSSHMDGATSERIVPSDHSAHQNPEAIEEVRRILKKYAR